MPRAKKTTKNKTAAKAAKTKEIKLEATSFSDQEDPKTSSSKQYLKKSKVWPLVFVVLIIVFVILIQKGALVAAIVNNRPIFQWDVVRLMYQRFGNQTLETLVTEKLIDSEASEKGIIVSSEEIEKRINEMVANIGGNVTIEELLSFQGISRTDFENQIKTQVIVEKILSQDIEVTDSQIDQYIASNSAVMSGAEGDALRQEAKEMLVNELIGQQVQSWFLELKEKANIYKFVKTE